MTDNRGFAVRTYLKIMGLIFPHEKKNASGILLLPLLNKNGGVCGPKYNCFLN